MLHGGDSRGSILVYNGKEGSEAEAELSSKYSRDFCGIRDDVVFDDET
jgi:hypothetical protein